MLENDEDNNESQNEMQNDEEEEIQLTNNNNKLNITQEENQNKNVSTIKENPNQTKDKTILDEEGNLLDQNDLSYNSEEDKTSIIVFDMEINFMKNVKQIDIVFLLDTTKSVNPYLKGIKRYIRKLLFDARKSTSHYLSDDFDILKYGLVAYRDHDQDGIQDSYVSKILCDLNDDYNVFRQALYDVRCVGGDDTCEAVVDGLHEAVNLIAWREDSIKLIYHICGGPCHGSDFNGKNGGKNFDKYKQGCPCGMDLKNILKTLRGKYIEYNLIGLEDNIKEMAKKFSEFIKVELVEANFEPQEGVSGDQTKEDE
jgi:hypothetical protein